jgi:hypothetical protein
MISNPRYDGKPLLRLLDMYVLWAIGKLPPDQEDVMNRAAPKLQARRIGKLESYGPRRNIQKEILLSLGRELRCVPKGKSPLIRA